MVSTFMHCAALWCWECIRPALQSGLAEKCPGNEFTLKWSGASWTIRKTIEASERLESLHGLCAGVATDTDRVPSFVGSEGGGDSDYPAHCDGCGRFLENSLTPEGERYVASVFWDFIETGTRADCLEEWEERYLGSRPTLHPNKEQFRVLCDDPEAFERYLRILGACSDGIAMAKGKGFREAWNDTENVMLYGEETAAVRADLCRGWIADRLTNGRLDDARATFEEIEKEVLP